MSLFEIFKKEVLSATEVAEKAIEEKLAPPNNTPDYIKANFSELVEQIQIDAYHIYLQEQQRAGNRAIEKDIREKMTVSSTPDDVVQIVSSMFEDLDRFFLSLTQSRRPRAGKAFELVLKTLFRRLRYPFDEQQVINGQPDFLMPGKRHFDVNSMDCIIFTVKRTLRERWRQIVTEGTRGLGFFLATIDESISSPQLKEMKSNRIYLVVPERIKDNLEGYRKAPNVISFESFFTHHLDPAVTRWRAGDIL